MDDSEEWTNSVDRGGLKHVNNMTYMLFVEMELVLRRHLNSRRASELCDLKEAIAKIISDDDVLFYWSMLSVDWEEEEAQVLLHMIAEHWMTLRGFSFASAFMEKYKQRRKTYKSQRGSGSSYKVNNAILYMCK